MSVLRLALAFALAIALSACGSDVPVESAWLVDEAPDRGVDFVLDNSASGRFGIPETLPGGVALFDADGDGDLDLYLVQAGSIDDAASRPGNRFYLNDGLGHFTVASGSGAEDTGWGVAVATGDVDADGVVDLYVANLGPDRLLRGLGDGRFEDWTEHSGIALEGLSTGAAFGDLDGDGDQDLVVIQYLDWSWAREKECYTARGERDFCAPSNYPYPAIDHLYENLGDGRFRDATESSGLAEFPGTGLGLAIADLTGDGRADIVVANDGRADRLWVNQGDLRFVDEALIRGSAIGLDGKARAGMGLDLADLDQDGDLDQLVVNLAGESDTLLRNDSERFVEMTAASGLSLSTRTLTRFGANFADFDQDGWNDLLIATGRVEQPESSKELADPYAEPAILLRGVEAWRFEPVEHAFAEPLVRSSRGIALGDLDGDGDVDAVMSHHGSVTSVLINQASKRGDSMIIDIRERSGALALGAKVRMLVGERLFVAEIRTTRGYASASDHRLHLGLGTQPMPTELEVTWSDGTIELFTLSDEQPTVHRGEGRELPPSPQNTD